jgi:hypothetical protein
MSHIHWIKLDSPAFNEIFTRMEKIEVLCNVFIGKKKGGKGRGKKKEKKKYNVFCVCVFCVCVGVYKREGVCVCVCIYVFRGFFNRVYYTSKSNKSVKEI